jgi:hypothetical protein
VTAAQRGRLPLVEARRRRLGADARDRNAPDRALPRLGPAVRAREPVPASRRAPLLRMSRRLRSRRSEGWSRSGERERRALPWHRWEFDIASGRSLVDERLRVRRYAVRVEEEEVVVTLDQPGRDAPSVTGCSRTSRRRS